MTERLDKLVQRYESKALGKGEHPDVARCEAVGLILRAYERARELIEIEDEGILVALCQEAITTYLTDPSSKEKVIQGLLEEKSRAEVYLRKLVPEEDTYHWEGTAQRDEEDHRRLRGEGEILKQATELIKELKKKNPDTTNS